MGTPENDAVVAKRVPSPSLKEFDRLIRKARAQAKSAGLKRADVFAAVSHVRKITREVQNADTLR